MENLERYAAQFDAEYPNYADKRYSEISAMMSRYDSDAFTTFLASDSFKMCVEFIRPLIAIKNYKTQIPFPEDITTAIEIIVEIRKVNIVTTDRFNKLVDKFNRLVDMQGFQLPTISAIFHFSHPENFPIVDKNVQAACKILIDRNAELIGFEYPQIPAPGTSPTNKLNKYREFIQVIDRIREIHPDSHLKNDYRSIDKALMVLGSEGL